MRQTMMNSPEYKKRISSLGNEGYRKSTLLDVLEADSLPSVPSTATVSPVSDSENTCIAKIEPVISSTGQVSRHTGLMKILKNRRGSFIDNGIHFYFHVFTMPKDGLLNIPYINDIPPLQLEYHGKSKEFISNMLEVCKAKAAKIDAFIGLNRTFCEHVKELYEIDVPYGYFASFQQWFNTTSAKRDEIVYLDNSATDPYGFNEHLAFLHSITNACNIRTLFVSKRFSIESKKIRDENNFNVDIKSNSEYDYGSKYGILMNTMHFNQAYESLPRKMLTYLMCNMKVLTDESWVESINFMKENGADPFIYRDVNDIKNIGEHSFGVIDPHNFCIENRIRFLDEELKRLASLVAKG